MNDYPRDGAGWISGACAPGQLTAVGWIREGDIIAYDGRELTVTADPSRGWFTDRGERVHGLEIACRAENARWYLYRRDGDFVLRVRSGGAS